MKYFKKIEGERVYLSPINPDDYEIFTEWINDIDTTVRLGQAINQFSLRRERNYLEEVAQGNICELAIVEKETNKVIGSCSLYNISHINRVAEFGIMIGDKSCRAKGYGTEAVSLMINYGFKILNLSNIMLRVIEFNINAIKAYEKVGFKQFGKRTKSYYVNGKYFDEIYFEILAEEFVSPYLAELP